MPGSGPAIHTIESQRRVQPLSAHLLAAAVRSAGSDATLHLITGPESLLTAAAFRTVSDAGRWVVRGADGVFDGASGESLRWDGTYHVGTSEVARDWLQPFDSRIPLATQVLLSISLQHRHRSHVEFGVVADSAVSALTGSGLYGWGVCEPVTEPWDTSAMTSYTRTQSPHSIELTSVGEAASATIAITGNGPELTENLSLVLAMPGGDSGVHQGVHNNLVHLLNAHPIAFAIAYRRRGRRDLLTPCQAQPAPEPICVAFGPRAVHMLGADVIETAATAVPVRVGRARIPGLVVGLGDKVQNGWDALRVLVEGLGVERIKAAAPDLTLTAHAKGRAAHAS
ncbi:hypothetical protein SAMN05444157_0982 [Frankineae bacterium MT45]|nr:hypothetical protein SAMN05444157_0982 [Frankineae bacterium MT45]